MNEENHKTHDDEMTKDSKPGQFFIMIKLLLVFLGLAIFVGVAFVDYQLFKQQMSFNDILHQLTQKTTKMQEKIDGLSTFPEALQQLNKKTDEITQKQEALQSSWDEIEKGDLDRFRIAEAHYLTKFANDRLQFVDQRSLAIDLVKRADAILESIKNDALVPIRNAIAEDLTKLQAEQTIDIDGIYARLNALDHLISELPLLDDLARQNYQSTQSPSDAIETPAWRHALDRAWQQLRQVVVVRRLQANAMPLILPDEKTFLYQNLAAQLENAMWGVLHRDDKIYQISLSRASAWVNRYFVLDSEKTKTFLNEVSSLQQINIDRNVSADFSDVLQLFEGLPQTKN